MRQVAGLRASAAWWEDKGFPNSAARARQLADALESGNYWKGKNAGSDTAGS